MSDQTGPPGYTEADVLLVSDTLDEDIDSEVWTAGTDAMYAARRVLAALTEAGRLLPADTRTVEDFRQRAGQRQRRIVALGPWVPAPEEFPDVAGDVR